MSMISRGSAVSETPRMRSLVSGVRSGKDDSPGLSHTVQESVKKEQCIFPRLLYNKPLSFSRTSIPESGGSSQSLLCETVVILS